MAKLFANDLNLQFQRLGIMPGAGDQILPEQRASYESAPAMLELITAKYPFFTQKFSATSEISKIWQPDDFVFVVPSLLGDLEYMDPGQKYRFIMLGHFDAGNYLVCLDLNDKNPDDPSVFILDHYSPSQEPKPDAKLSEFLGQLEANKQSSGSGLQPGQKPKARPKMAKA